MIILPVIFTIVMPIVMLIGVIMDPEGMAAEFGKFAEFGIPYLGIPENYNPVLTASMVMIKMIVLQMFLMIPGMIPVMIASDSFAGEKERKTMESIALLPISKIELILGKVLTAFVPSILITFACFGAMGLTVNLLLLEHLEGNILIFTDLTFLLVTFLLSPLLAYLNILVSTIISSRSKDLKSAQSISGALVAPALAVIFIQMFNPAFLSPIMIIVLSGVLLGLCLIFMDVANKVLDIEKLILTL